jgi:beta-phosphoglucomutase
VTTTSANARGVIFDLDGVLVNTGPFHKESWYDLAAKEGFEMSDELFYTTFGMQNYQIIPLLARRPLSRPEIDAWGQWKEARYRDLIKGRLVLLAGVKELLMDLKRSGFRTAIGTSTPRVNLDFMLDQTSSAGYFDAYATGEDVKNGKPAPDTFLKAAERLDLSPSRCVVVEDAVQGVEAAKAANMKVIAITTTRPRKDLSAANRIIDSMTELSAQDFQHLLDRR